MLKKISVTRGVRDGTDTIGGGVKMARASGSVAAALVVLLVSVGGVVRAQRRQQTPPPARDVSGAASPLTGVYRINISRSDKLYSVVSGASSNLPFGEQQRFFIDLAVRLTPPDLIAIERRGRAITLGSSRSPRITLVADGVTHSERADDGRVIRSRTTLDGGKLIFTSSGRAEDNFSVVFAPLEGGRRLRVTRHIFAENLNEPVVIQTVYDKISDDARWDIYGEPLLAKAEETARTAPAARSPSAGPESDAAEALRGALVEWIGATNSRDIEKQMGFYMPRLKAFYLTRDVSRGFVRAEKARAFTTADLIDIRAEEPEIIFRDGGATAIMRFRKSYRIEDGARSRRGVVIQELRWQRTEDGWKIVSERDVRVIR